MFTPSLVHSSDELQQILLLQENNLRQHLSPEEKQSQGFVTLQHDLPTLQKMHTLSPGIVIKKDNAVVAYALTMAPGCRELIPALEPMYALLDKLNWENKPLSAYNYYVMGQICIDKQYRGQGLFEMLYHFHRTIYSPQFDLFITEIATRNHRSLRAHTRIGFKVIHTYKDELDEWAVVGWNWT
ncbi:MAG TPA: GNAT family N-acetyltransferase [Chitinophagaceae bacterium]|nr:GNAT family N-acetyltransferase [Chitinophagaceae bacterium]